MTTEESLDLSESRDALLPKTNASDPAFLDLTRTIADVRTAPGKCGNLQDQDVPSAEKQVLANSYIGFARLLCFILLGLAILSFATSGYIIHRAIADAPNSSAFDTSILPSFVLCSGSCGMMKHVDEGLLFVANIIGGLCLAISGYLQQLCTSPTHEDIFSEMQKYGDIDFGCNSLSSLFRRASKQKTITALWVALILTSIPGHLLLNGAIGLAPTLLNFSPTTIFPNMTTDVILEGQLNWTNVSSQECVDIISYVIGPYNLNISSLTVVLQPESTSACNVFLSSIGQGSISVSPKPNESNAMIEQLADLINCDPNPILYCLVDVVNEQCGVTIRWLPFLIFSSALVVKAITACIAFNFLPHFRKRLYNNLGDFISFAVENPDITIPNESLCSRRKNPKSNPSSEIIATHRSKSWISFMEMGDVLSYIFLFAVAITAWIIGIWSIVGPGHSFTWQQPDFGLIPNVLDTLDDTTSNISPGFYLMWNSLFASLLVANIAQLPISIGYTLFNYQITRLWREYEWRSFYRGKRKKPRTAIGYPGTRPTRWLQLPYLLSAILFLVSVVLHWLASQAFYFVESYENSFQQLVYIVYQIPLPTIVLAITWTLLVLTITIIYLRPQRSLMPVMCGSGRVVFASCCSLRELPKEGIVWGDITELGASAPRKAGFAFTARRIVEGQIYS